MNVDEGLALWNTKMAELMSAPRPAPMNVDEAEAARRAQSR
jgi:hypothetical protein